MYKSSLLFRKISCCGLLAILSCTHNKSSSGILSKPQEIVSQIGANDGNQSSTADEEQPLIFKTKTRMEGSSRNTSPPIYIKKESYNDRTYTEEENTQIFVKDTYGHSHVLEVCLEKDTVLSLKQRIEDILGYNTGSQLICHGNKHLNDITTTNNLLDCGLQKHSSLELNMKILGGGGIKCPNIKESTTKDLVYGGCFWREICKGLTIWIKCENPHCVSKGSHVAVCKNKGEFDISKIIYPDEDKGEKPLGCTACSTIVKPKNIKGFSFRECKYKLWGYRTETQSQRDTMELYKKEGSIYGDLKSHKFESEEWTWWFRLNIRAT